MYTVSGYVDKLSGVFPLLQYNAYERVAEQLIANVQDEKARKKNLHKLEISLSFAAASADAAGAMPSVHYAKHNYPKRQSVEDRPTNVFMTRWADVTGLYGKSAEEQKAWREKLLVDIINANGALPIENGVPFAVKYRVDGDAEWTTAQLCL